MKVSYIFALIVLTLGCWLSASFLWGALGLVWLPVLAIVALLLISTLVWGGRKMSPKVWIYARLTVLGVLFLPTSMRAKVFPAHPSQPLDSYMAPTFLLILSLALVIASLLIYSSLNLLTEWQSTGAIEDEDSQTQRMHAGRTASIALILSALLITNTLHNLYWFTVWDNTVDPLRYIWLIVPFLAVLFSAVMLSITLPGRTKVVSFLYLLLIPASMIAVSARAQSVDFRQLTEQRAGLTSQAIETYYTREGRYPQDL